MLLMLRGAVPLLSSDTVLLALVAPTFWLPKLRLVGFSCTAGAGMKLVPVISFFNDPASAEIYTLSLHDALPISAGVKVTVMVQLALTASVLEPLGQLLVWAKSLALVPVSAML